MPFAKMAPDRVTVTVLPRGADDGEMPVMVGVSFMVKAFDLVTPVVAPGFLTFTFHDPRYALVGMNTLQVIRSP